MPPVIATRQGWLESLRGIAALQVFLLHLLGAFWLPAVTGEGPAGVATWLARSPLALLYDGESAVSLFFLLSGAGLAGALPPPPAPPRPPPARPGAGARPPP